MSVLWKVIVESSDTLPSSELEITKTNEMENFNIAFPIVL